MKLGRDTASLTNYVLSGTNGQPEPTVGMGVTVLRWTDRDAGTLVRVSPSGKTFWFTLDRAERVDDNGMSESQTYRYTPRPDGVELTARLSKSGAYRCNGAHVRLGDRDAYHDYSF